MCNYTKGDSVSAQTSGPLVSVLIPVYNVERYLAETLDSVLSQTYTNLEIVVVDDHSTDATWDVAAAYAGKDLRIRVFHNASNLQIAQTLNVALAASSGQFIARCDGDDVMEPDRIARQLAFLDQNPSISLVGCSFKTIDEGGQVLRAFRYPSGPRLLRSLLRYWSPVSHIWLARREVYEELRGYRMQSVEDYDFLSRAALLGYDFDNIPNYFGMRVRIRGGNTVTNYGISQRRLFNYAKSVNRRGQTHLYAEDDVKKILAARDHGILAYLHRRSDRLSNSASSARFLAVRFALHTAAAILSPYKAQYYYFATMRRIVIWKHEKAQDKSNKTLNR